MGKRNPAENAALDRIKSAVNSELELLSHESEQRSPEESKAFFRNAPAALISSLTELLTTGPYEDSSKMTVWERLKKLGDVDMQAWLESQRKDDA